MRKSRVEGQTPNRSFAATGHEGRTLYALIIRQAARCGLKKSPNTSLLQRGGARSCGKTLDATSAPASGRAVLAKALSLFKSEKLKRPTIGYRVVLRLRDRQ
jgi:hypothetical protein